MISTRFGDLYAVGGEPPTRLLRPLAAIGRLHQIFDAQDWLAVGKSKESCILCALTVRDFLRRAGLTDAAVRSVMTIIVARDASGVELHSLGIGARDAPGEGWNGHLVVTVGGWLIDPTLWQATKSSHRHLWADIPTALALPLLAEPNCLAGLSASVDDHTVDVAYVDQSDNMTWKRAPDANPKRRQVTVELLMEILRSRKRDIRESLVE